MGLFTKSLIIVAFAIMVPFAYRNYAPESTKSSLSALLSNYKSIDDFIKVGSSYFDQLSKYLDVENKLKQFTLTDKKQESSTTPAASTKPPPVVTEPPTPTTPAPVAKKVNYVDCKTEKPEAQLQLFTKEELAKYDGTPGSGGLLIAFLGSVYDVERNRQYYGPGGDYAFFSGKDATRAFLTGNFNPDELTDNLDGIPRENFDEIQNWLSFYEKEYTKVGRLIGTFFDASGCPTKQLKEVDEVLKGRTQAKNNRRAEETIFPECNSEWNADQKQSRLWCSKMSGGIERDWAGVPRQLYSPETKTYRCACVRDVGPRSNIEGHAYSDKETNNGDLDHPRLKQYDNCKPESIDCFMSQQI